MPALVHSFEVWVGGEFILPEGSVQSSIGTCNLEEIYMVHNELWSSVMAELESCEMGRNIDVPEVGDAPYFTIDQPLYALVDAQSNYTLGVSMNMSYLNNLAMHITSDDNSEARKRSKISQGLTVVTLNATNVRYHPQHPVISSRQGARMSNLQKRDWTDTATYVFYYAAGGAVLMVLEKHNNWGWYRKVVDLYFSLAWAFGAAMGKIAYLLQQGFIYGFVWH